MAEQQQGLFTPLGTKKFNIRELVTPKVYDSGIAEGIQGTLRNTASLVGTFKEYDKEQKNLAYKEFKNKLSAEQAQRDIEDTQLGIDFNNLLINDDYINASYKEKEAKVSEFYKRATDSMTIGVTTAIPKGYENDSDFTSLHQEVDAKLRGTSEKKQQFISGILQNNKEEYNNNNLQINALSSISRLTADPKNPSEVDYTYTALSEKIGVSKTNVLFKTAYNMAISNTLAEIQSKHVTEQATAVTQLKQGILTQHKKLNKDGTGADLYIDLFEQLDGYIKTKQTAYVSNEYQTTKQEILKSGGDLKKVNNLITTFEKNMTALGVTDEVKSIYENEVTTLYATKYALIDEASRKSKKDAEEANLKSVVKDYNNGLLNYDNLKDKEKHLFKQAHGQNVSNAFVFDPTDANKTALINYMSITYGGANELENSFASLIKVANEDPKQLEAVQGRIGQLINIIQKDPTLSEAIKREKGDLAKIIAIPGITGKDVITAYLEPSKAMTALQGIKDKKELKLADIPRILADKANKGNSWSTKGILGTSSLRTDIDSKTILKNLTVNQHTFLEGKANISTYLENESTSSIKSKQDRLLAEIARKDSLIKGYLSLPSTNVIFHKDKIGFYSNGVHIKDYNYGNFRDYNYWKQKY